MRPDGGYIGWMLRGGEGNQTGVAPRTLALIKLRLITCGKSKYWAGAAGSAPGVITAFDAWPDKLGSVLICSWCLNDSTKRQLAHLARLEIEDFGLRRC
jgi:hypothetical protein